MQPRMPRDHDRPKTLVARLDRIAREMNAFLVVLAIGLATLDATCYWAKAVSDAFAHHVVAADAPQTPPPNLTAAVTQMPSPPVP